MTELRTKTVSGIKWTSISSITLAMLQLIQLSILARLLSPEDFGLMAMVLVIVGFAQAFADMGISNAIIHFQDTKTQELSCLYWLNIVSGLAIFFLVWILTPLVVHIYKEPRLLNLLLWASFSFLIIPIGQLYQILLEKELSFELLAKIDVLASFVSAITGVLTAMHGQGAYALVWSMLSNAMSRSLALAITGWSFWRPSLHFAYANIARYIKFGLYQIGERSINNLGWHLDKFLIGALLGAETLGYYSIAYQLMMRPLQIINPIFTRVAFPAFAKIQTEISRLKIVYLEMVSTIAILLLPVYMGMIALAEPLITVLFGSAWLPSVQVLRILCLLGIIFSLENPCGSLLLAKGRPDLGFHLNVLMIITYSISIWIGAKFGITGIAWSLVISTTTILFPASNWIRKVVVEMKFSEYVQAFLPLLILSGTMGFLVYILAAFVGASWHHTIKLPVFVFIGVGLYAGMILTWQWPLIMRLRNMARS